MKTYSRFVRKHQLFFSLFLFFIIISLLILCSGTKVNCFIWLNSVHNKWLDDFFIPITYLGDGVVSIVLSLMIIVVWRQYRLGLRVLISFLLSGVIVQILKQIFSEPRPKEVISSTHYHFFINGITHGGWSSFPSGHSTSIFALITILIFYFRNPVACFSLMLLGIIVGYSRIYLGQHFLEDVVTGAIIGTATSIFVYNFTHEKQWPYLRFPLKKDEKGKASYLS